MPAPDTIATIPEKTLHAFADHAKVGVGIPVGGGDAEAVLEELRHQGIDDQTLTARQQREGTAAFSKSWSVLLSSTDKKSSQLVVAASQ